MRKLIPLILLLPFLFGGTTYITGQKGVKGNVVYETVSDLTLYVRTTGLDTNDCLSSGSACLTIQEAVDRVPKHIKHLVKVDVGPGSFVGFILTGFAVEFTGQLLVEGTMETAAPATGTATGTATSGSTTQCVDSGQTWTADDLKGKMVLVNGEYRFVRTNDATTLELVGPLGATCSGKAYEVVAHAALVTSLHPVAIKAFIEVHANSAAGQQSSTWSQSRLILSQLSSDDVSDHAHRFVHNWGGAAVSLQRIRVKDKNHGCYWANTNTRGYSYDGWFEDCENGLVAWGADYLRWYRTYASGGQMGVYIHAAQDVVISYAYLSNMSYGGFYLYTCLYVAADHIISEGGVQYGGRASGVLVLDFDGNLAFDNNTGHGLLIEGCPLVDIDGGSFSNNGGWGLLVDTTTAQSYIDTAGTITIENNVSGGIWIKNHGVITLKNAIGSNTGPYGLHLDTGSYAVVNSTTGVTGATGDATINDGTTTLTWATDFASNGDKVTNLSNFCTIERQD